MTLSSLSAFSISLTFAALALVLGPGEAQAEITCGSTLGPGGTYVLNTDLVCPASADKYGPGVLLVVGGATLDLNGHTVTCSNRGWGIRVNCLSTIWTANTFGTAHQACIH
jgi:hypothetical protein